MDEVRVALRGMLGPNAGIGVTDPTVASNLWPQEADAIADAIPKRQTEFAAGRRAARAALAELGLAPIAIQQGTDRAPVWPPGIAGSISHCAQCCIAVVARTTDYQTLGVDVEPATGLDPDLVPIVCTPTEQTWVATQPNPGLAAKLIFSAKEAIYKAQHPLTGKIIDFDAVTLRVTDQTFSTTPTPTLPAMKGAILIQEGLILTVALG